MAGGLIQLVAYGNQDLFLTRDPQITFFKIVYRRHTNFSLEVIPQNFIHRPDFGERVTCILSRNGDLIRKVHVVIELPIIPEFILNNELDEITKFAWVKRIGFAIIKTVDIEIGDELIDRHYGDWLNIWYELTTSRKKNIDRLIGDIESITSFTNGKPSFRIYIPLQFWFNRITGLALPVVSLQYNYIKINLEINEFNNCHFLSPSHYINVDNDFVHLKKNEIIMQNISGDIVYGKFIYFDILNRRLYFSKLSSENFLSLQESDQTILTDETLQKEKLYEEQNGELVNANYFIIGKDSRFEVMPRINSAETIYTNPNIDLSNISLKDCFLLVEYIFLDDEERIKFAQARHEYLIEQLIFNTREIINGFEQTFNVGFSQPCKEIIWISQLESNIHNNDHFNYSNSIFENNNDQNTIIKETILFNGHERVSFRDSEYFTLIQPYQHHTHYPTSVINLYSFSNNPENHQPTGASNLSRIDNVNLKISCDQNINFNFQAELRIYGIVSNFLRISNGISGIVFSIDFK